MWERSLVGVCGSWCRGKLQILRCVMCRDALWGRGDSLPFDYSECVCGGEGEDEGV